MINGFNLENREQGAGEQGAVEQWSSGAVESIATNSPPTSAQNPLYPAPKSELLDVIKAGELLYPTSKSQYPSGLTADRFY